MVRRPRSRATTHQTAGLATGGSNSRFRSPDAGALRSHRVLALPDRGGGCRPPARLVVRLAVRCSAASAVRRGPRHVTQHLLEVWGTILACFALGSLLGWLLYRWIERTDYSYDQHEFARRIAQLVRRIDRLPGEEAVELDEALLAAGTSQHRVRRRYRRRGEPDGAAVLRERVQTSSLAAAWRQRRQGPD